MKASNGQQNECLWEFVLENQSFLIRKAFYSHKTSLDAHTLFYSGNEKIVRQLGKNRDFSDMKCTYFIGALVSFLNLGCNEYFVFIKSNYQENRRRIKFFGHILIPRIKTKYSTLSITQHRDLKFAYFMYKEKQSIKINIEF